ncbi:MAG: SprT family zinc-dependent metalloprotease [Negativicutes bacterium]|nr:SprT family zinc-dependent metalloprotease [Negativicutes bacterium]
MPNITINHMDLTFHIEYSNRRRSVRIRIVPPAAIEVVAPTGLSQKEIELLLHKRTTWIAAQLARLAVVAASPLNASLADDAPLLYLGLIRRLAVLPSPARRAKVVLEDERLAVYLPATSPDDKADLVADALRKWYIRSASQLLTERTAYWAREIGVRPHRLSIRDQKTRWGSASTRGNVNYNWRIIMAPPETVDYLVVHELCHIKVPNHSATFWLLVSQSVPDYKQHRAWLRQHGPVLARLLSN